MKKYINKYIISCLAGMALLFVACEDGETVFDEIVSEETRGAVLRTISIDESEVLYDVATSSIIGGGFTVTLEAQDEEDGDLLSSVDVYYAFVDNTDEAGTDNDLDEIFVETIPASAFSIGEFGLPRTTYSVTADQLQTALGIANSQIFGGDQFTVRFEMILTDGRTYSFANNSGTLTGAFYNSPFLYNVNIVCAPSQPTAGTWTVNTTDTFGDGWNGGELVIVLDGDSDNPIIIANIDDGTRPFAESVQDFTFEVPDGTETISITYTSGDFDEEVLFTVTSANGNEVIDEGPTPPVDTELLDYCPNNL